MMFGEKHLAHGARFAAAILCVAAVSARAIEPQSEVRPPSPVESVTTPTESPTGSITTTIPPAQSPVSLRLEVRPSFLAGTNTVRSYNSTELSYAFTKTRSIMGQAAFDVFSNANTNNNNYSTLFADSRIQGNINDLWVNGPLALEFQPRAHIPVDPTKRARGLNTELRPQFNLNRRFSNLFTLSTTWAPSYYWYSHASYVDKGVVGVNPNYENRIELVGKFQFTEQWKLEVGARWWAARFRSAQNVAMSNKWLNNVSLKPELSYQATRQLTIGAALETGTFLNGTRNVWDADAAWRSVQGQAFAVLML